MKLMDYNTYLFHMLVLAIIVNEGETSIAGDLSEQENNVKALEQSIPAGNVADVKPRSLSNFINQLASDIKSDKKSTNTNDNGNKRSHSKKGSDLTNAGTPLKVVKQRAKDGDNPKLSAAANAEVAGKSAPPNAGAGESATTNAGTLEELAAANAGAAGESAATNPGTLEELAAPSAGAAGESAAANAGVAGESAATNAGAAGELAAVFTSGGRSKPQAPVSRKRRETSTKHKIKEGLKLVTESLAIVEGILELFIQGSQYAMKYTY